MSQPWHFQDGAVGIRKACVGPLENNVYVVACRASGKAIVIDAAAEADRVIAACAGLSPVAILTTHGHHDHVGAARATSVALGLPVHIHPADADRAGLPEFEPITDGHAFAVGDLTMRAVHTPGHTAGSTSFVLAPTGGQGHLFSGDTLFPGGPGGTGGPGSSFEQIIASIGERMFTLPDDTLVHPGHGLGTTIGTERPQLPAWLERGW